jgi:quercetin dioxygenase-like cupin family protein
MTILNVAKPIHPSPWQSALIGIALALVVAVLTVTPAQATPTTGVMTEFIVGSATAGATFDELDISLKTALDPNGHGGPFWKARIDTKGASDLYVVRNTFAIGGQTGWHTHPGPSLITVTAGTITAYEGDDPSCTPHVYPAGSTFIDAGGGHVHLLRNEGSVPAITVAVQLVPAGASRRIDVTPAPGNCSF